MTQDSGNAQSSSSTHDSSSLASTYNVSSPETTNSNNGIVMHSQKAIYTPTPVETTTTTSPTNEALPLEQPNHVAESPSTIELIPISPEEAIAVAAANVASEVESTTTPGKEKNTNTTVAAKVGAFFKRNCNAWQFLGHGAFILGTIFFSVWQILGKYALTVFHPVVFTFIRCGMTAVLIMPLMVLVDKDFTFYPGEIDSIFLQSKFPNFKDTLLFAVCGFLQVVANNVGFALGLYLTDPVVAAIISQSLTVFTTIIALILKVDKPGFIKFIGIGLALIGSVAIILLNNWSAASGFAFSWTKVIGVCCFLFNNAAYALCIVIQKRIMSRGVPVITITFWSFTLGTLMLALVAPFFAYYSMDWSKITLEAWGATAYSAVFGGAVGFLLLNFGTKVIGPTVVVYSSVMPFLNSVLSYFILNTTINYFIFICAVIIIAGVMLVIISNIKDYWIPARYCNWCCKCCCKKKTNAVVDEPTAQPL